MKKLLISFALVCVFLLGSVGVASAHALPHPHHRGPGFGYGYGYPGYVPAATTTGTLDASHCAELIAFIDSLNLGPIHAAQSANILNNLGCGTTTAPTVPSSPFGYGYCPFCYRGRR